MIRIVPLTEEHVSAAKAFNARMRAGHAPTDFYLPVTAPRPRDGPHPAVYTTQFLAVEDADVRGGFIELVHPAWVNGGDQVVANYQAPLSEGICDKKYGLVGMQMIRHMQQHRPYLFVVGMGNAGNPLPRLLRASQWDVFPVPFLFRIENAAAFLRNIAPLRGTAVKRIAVQAAGVTGIGWAASRVLRTASLPAWMASRRYSIEPLEKWGAWVDPLWDQFRQGCSFGVIRNQATLDLMYPLGSGRVLAWVVMQGKNPVGWATGLNTQMQNHKYFGNLRVGTVLDCVATPEAAVPVAWLAARMLARAGADLVLTNQQHLFWRSAFRKAGFFEGPSQYLLAISKRLVEESARGGGRDAIHVTRGDGDGRINL